MKLNSGPRMDPETLQTLALTPYALGPGHMGDTLLKDLAPLKTLNLGAFPFILDPEWTPDSGPFWTPKLLIIVNKDRNFR